MQEKLISIENALKTAPYSGDIVQSIDALLETIYDLRGKLKLAQAPMVPDELLTAIETEQDLRRVENEESDILIEHQRNSLIKVLDMIGDTNPEITQFVTAALGD